MAGSPSSSSSHTAEAADDMPAHEVVKPTTAENRPFSAGFWDRDSRTATVRGNYFFFLIRGTFITGVAIMAILSIYWGAFWKIDKNIHHFNGWVVDFDSDAMGQAVQRAAFDATGPLQSISWSVIPASQFPNGPSDVVQAVEREKCWVAIVVNPNATSRLNAAVSTADASYNGSFAATVYGSEARNENSYPVFIAPQSQAVINSAAVIFAAQHARQLASNPNLSTLLSNAPNVVTQPLHYTVDNLHPFDVPAAAAADFIGLIYLIIIAFTLTNLHLAARMESGLEGHLRLGSLIGVRLVAPIVMYFILSLLFSLLSLAFQIPFNRRFGHAGFVIFWMLSWMAMCGLGLAIEAMMTLLTPRFASYFMILWIIVDVSVSYYPIPLLPGVFKYGYGTIFYNVSRAVRTIIFSTRDQIGMNFGVVFAWIGISLMTIPLLQWYRRRGAVREWRDKQAKDRQSSEKTVTSDQA